MRLVDKVPFLQLEEHLECAMETKSVIQSNILYLHKDIADAEEKLHQFAEAELVSHNQYAFNLVYPLLCATEYWPNS